MKTNRCVVAVLALAAAPVFADPTEPPIPPGVNMASWQDNGRNGQYVLQLAQGRALASGERVAGTVKTDSDCEPDAQGLNHCHNTIELKDGTRIGIINTHQMSHYPCLSPGEPISLVGLNPYWITGAVTSR